MHKLYLFVNPTLLSSSVTIATLVNPCFSKKNTSHSQMQYQVTYLHR